MNVKRKPYFWLRNVEKGDMLNLEPVRTAAYSEKVLLLE
jgi:hypothetical protein